MSRKMMMMMLMALNVFDLDLNSINGCDETKLLFWWIMWNWMDEGGEGGGEEEMIWATFLTGDLQVGGHTWTSVS